MNWIELIGTTLIHFIWQGALLMGIAMALLIALKNATSQAKYIALCGVLVAMALAPVITAVIVAPEATVIQISNLPVTTATPTFSFPDTATPQATIFDERHLRPVVIIWLIGVFALALRVLGGFLSLVGLRNKGHLPVPEELQAKFTALAKRIGITKIPSLRISSKVTVPTVIGAFRGIVLLPASVATGMSPRMLETILAHELAHVARYDFLINALQSVIEVVLFYHPAVWWVSQRIREERENCCDDLVIATISDRKTYARALTTLAELRGHSLAVRADGGELLDRVRRILGETPMKSIVSPIPVAILLGALIFVPAMQAFAASQNDPIAKKKPPVASQKKKSTKVKEVPVKMREVVANPASQPTKTAIREVPAKAKASKMKVKIATGVDSKGKLIIREQTADDLVKDGTVIREVPQENARTEANGQVKVTDPVVGPNTSEVAIPASITPPQLPQDSPFTGNKNSKDYLIYQIGQEIESLLEMRRALLAIIRQGEFAIVDKQMQMEVLRREHPGDDKAKIAEWERALNKLRVEIEAGEESGNILEKNLKQNELKLEALRKRLDDASK